MALNDRFVEFPDRVIVEERAAALVLPGAGHGRNAQRRVHLRRAIAAAGETVAEAEERPFCLTDQTGEGLDLFHPHAANRRRPFRRAARKMRLELARTIGVTFHIRPGGLAFAEQYMHDSTGEGVVGAGPQNDIDVVLFYGVVVVDIDGLLLVAG